MSYAQQLRFARQAKTRTIEDADRRLKAEGLPTYTELLALARELHAATPQMWLAIERADDLFHRIGGAA